MDVIRNSPFTGLFPKQTLLAGSIALVAVILSGCGGSGSSGDVSADEDNLPLSSDLDADVATPWVNGFRLVRESIESASGVLFSDDSFVLGADGRSFERSSALDSAEQPARIEVIHRFDDNGFIVSRENVAPSGLVSQRFDSSFDSRGRKSAEQSFNGSIPFLTSSFERDSNGRLTRQQLINTNSGDLFSTRTYTYSSISVLESITLASPQLSFDLIDEFTFDEATGQLTEKRAIDAATGGVDNTTIYSYDNEGNLTLAEERGASGAVTLISRFEYEVVEGSVPNLPLHQITHDIETF